MLSIGPPNYPEISERVYLVRSPWIFQTVWSWVSPLLPERTQNKVNVLGADFTEVLAGDLQGGINRLPDFLGGNVSQAQHGIPQALAVEAYIDSEKKAE